MFVDTERLNHLTQGFSGFQGERVQVCGQGVCSTFCGLGSTPARLLLPSTLHQSWEVGEPAAARVSMLGRGRASSQATVTMVSGTGVLSFDSPQSRP